MSLLDAKTVAILEHLLASSSKRPLRETSAQFAAVFPGSGAAAFHALACLLAVLKVQTSLHLDSQRCRVQQQQHQPRVRLCQHDEGLCSNPDHFTLAAGECIASYCPPQDGPPGEWQDRLSGYHLLLMAGSLVRGLSADTFDAFLVEVKPLGHCNVAIQNCVRTIL